MSCGMWNDSRSLYQMGRDAEEQRFSRIDELKVEQARIREQLSDKWIRFGFQEAQ